MTPKELEAYYGEPPAPEDIAYNKYICAKDRDYNFQHLYFLYLNRNDPETAQRYYDMIKDEQRKLDADCLVGDAKEPWL